MKDDAPTAPLDDVDVPVPSIMEPRVRVIHSTGDDPDVRERLIQALRDVLAGRVG